MSKHDTAVAANAAKRASTRNVADMLEAFSAAKVVPGDKAREAMFAAIVREATRATPKAIAEVLHGLGSARGVGAGLQGAVRSLDGVVSSWRRRRRGRLPRWTRGEIADVLSSFGFAKPNKDSPATRRAALDAAVTREGPRRMSPRMSRPFSSATTARAPPRREAYGLLQKIG